jgi:hypothetical protein
MGSPDVFEREPAADEPALFPLVASQPMPMPMSRAVASAQSPIMIEEDSMFDMGALKIFGQTVHCHSIRQKDQVNGIAQKSRKNKSLSACLTLVGRDFTIRQIVL